MADTLSPTEVPKAVAAEATAQPAALDPHASKLAPDDPRLRLGRARGRTLRKGPAIALAASLSGVVLISLVIALEPNPSSADAKKGGAEANITGAPVVPDAIRFAPDTPAVGGPPLHLALDGGAPVERSNFAASSNEARNPYSPEHQRQIDEEQAWKAQNSGVLFDIAGNGVATPSRSAVDQGDFEASRSAPLGAPAAAPAAASEDLNLQAHKNDFLDHAGAARAKNLLEARVEKPLSPYEVKAGSIIPAVLLTAINSDLPGPVIGQVRENVYDTVTGNYLLIPQGSRVLASYDSMVSWGQERVLVCWNRLIFPNGDSIHLDCMPAADLQGAAGITDDVNEHWGRLIKGAAISSLLAATSQAVAGNTEGFNPTVTQTWARNAAGEVNSIGQRLTARNLNIQPTITVRAGYSVNVMVNQDLIIPPYRLGSPRPSTLEPPIRKEPHHG